MKKIFCLVLILIVFGFRGFSQITYTPMIASGYQIKYLKTDSGFALPLRDTTIGRGINRAGALVVRAADNLPYYYNGTNWVLLGTSGGLVPDVTLQDAFDNDPTALPKINAHNQSFNVDSTIGVTLSSRSNSISGKIGQIALSAGTFSLQNSTPQVGGTFGSTVSSADSLLVGLAKNNANETRFRLSPSDFLVSRLGGSYKSVGTSINGNPFDETGNIELTSGRFGIEDNTGVQNRAVDMQGFDFTHSNAGVTTFSANDLELLTPTNPEGSFAGITLFTNPGAASGFVESYTEGSSLDLSGDKLAANFGVSPIERFRVDSIGTLRLSKYGTGAITGTPTYNLAVDASGNFIEVATGGGAIGNTGSAYRLVTGGGTLIKSVNRDLTLTVDSLTSGELTLKVDTAQIATTYDNSLKQNLVTLTTTGTSGASTFNQGTGALNIPTYAAGTGTVTSAALTVPSLLTVSGSPITTSGTFAVTWNGTVQGDLPYFSGTNTATVLAKDANATRYLSNQGTSNNPSWNLVNLANGVTGVLPLANGGTNSTDYTTATVTLTNKRWTARVGSTTSSATPTINTDLYDIYKLTAQTADITSFTTNLSGTPVDGDILEIQVTGTAARALTFGASFVSSTVTIPTTTVTTATLTIIFQYYTTSSYGNNKWVCAKVF